MLCFGMTWYEMPKEILCYGMTFEWYDMRFDCYTSRLECYAMVYFEKDMLELIVTMLKHP